jgi:DNA-binding Lrp family transcriptional regulator
MNTATIPAHVSDPVNEQILEVSEDRVQGFHEDPIGEIARLCCINAGTVAERLQAMLRAGTIRRVRQTLMSINLAEGGLVAWIVPEDRLQAAFDWMFQNDPFTGHIVIRSTDEGTHGGQFRLWTTLKVPQDYSTEKHCRYLMAKTGATAFKIMPAKKVFALGVGHIRRASVAPGSKSEVPAEPRDAAQVALSDLDWRVLTPLKREFQSDEILPTNLWAARAAEAGLSFDEFCRVARSLDRRGLIGRFSTFLEHVKPLASGERVTRFNGLFHWAVPPGREIEAGMQVARHEIMTHCYWREGGPEFNNVNIMGVIHGTSREMVHAHKQAIDKHLAKVGIPLLYTTVFWGQRSEIKPSEISPVAYCDWCGTRGLEPEDMRES